MIRAYAKINWTLNVIKKRADGYHELDTIMQRINLHDDIYISPADDIYVTCDGGIEMGAKNIAHKAARLYLDSFSINEGAKIDIIKRIPSEAGLGGGSADAAAVLLWLNNRHKKADKAALNYIAMNIGADVPYCLMDYAARCKGIGEKIMPIESANYHLLLVKPQVGISTGKLFASLKLDEMRIMANNERAAEVLQLGGADIIAPYIFNALSEAACLMEPSINEIIEGLKNNGAKAASMSGSGSCCYGLFESEQAANYALKHFSSYEFAKVCMAI